MVTLRELYGNQTQQAERRIAALRERFVHTFGDRPHQRLSSAPGRTEIIGNHTDHNHGKVLAAAIDLDAIAIAAPNGTDTVRLHSEGYGETIVHLGALSPQRGEEGQNAALIRGCAAMLAARGFSVAGLDICVHSTVLSGSGLSSSASFELLLLTLFSSFFADAPLPPMEAAKLAQKVENVYFGKPCGLMDQMASAMGGLITIDFAAEPVVEKLDFDFAAQGTALVVVNVGSRHDDLTDEYAAIPREMRDVAAFFGKSVLRELSRAELLEALPRLYGRVSDRAILRALHFFDENERVDDLAAALRAGDFDKFKAGIIASGDSSWKLLQNLYVPGHDEALPLALEVSRRMLEGQGAWRIHGGGFAGTILAFVPDARLDEYTARMSALFGETACTVLKLRAHGATELIL